MSNLKPSFPTPCWIEANFRTFLEAAPDATLVVDDHGYIVFANVQTEHLFGYSGSELLGQRIETLVPLRFRAKHPNHRAGYFARNSYLSPMGAMVDIYGSRKDGTEFPVETSLRPIQTPYGTMVISAIRDVTERRLAEAQTRKLNNDLEQALRRADKLVATGQLVATLVHEIHNPLESLMGLHHLLSMNRTLDDDARELVEAAKLEVGRLSNLSRQTLAPHRKTQFPVVTKLSELLDDIVCSFHRRLESAQIKVRREYQTEGIVMICPGELRQVFTNLISNAVDAMGECGELNLSIETSPDHEVAVRIADTGCGIPAENLNTIFDPFFTTKGENGTGIGLWVTKNITDKAGGRIEVVSSTTDKKGTCFSVFLSAIDAPPVECECSVDAAA